MYTSLRSSVYRYGSRVYWQPFRILLLYMCQLESGHRIRHMRGEKEKSRESELWIVNTATQRNVNKRTSAPCVCASKWQTVSIAPNSKLIHISHIFIYILGISQEFGLFLCFWFLCANLWVNPSVCLVVYGSTSGKYTKMMNFWRYFFRTEVEKVIGYFSDLFRWLKWTDHKSMS